MSVSDLPPAGLILRRAVCPLTSGCVTYLDEVVNAWARAEPTRCRLRYEPSQLTLPRDALLLGGADLARLPMDLLQLTPDECVFLARHPAGAIVPCVWGASIRYFADAHRCAAAWARLVVAGL